MDIYILCSHNIFISRLIWKRLSAENENKRNSCAYITARNANFEQSNIDTFLSAVDKMSCSAENYVSLMGSNGCADQLTNWDGSKKPGLAAPEKKKGGGMSRLLCISPIPINGYGSFLPLLNPYCVKNMLKPDTHT